MNEFLLVLAGMKKAAIALLPIAVLTAIAGVARVILSKERHSWTGFFRGLVLAVATGLISWSFMEDIAFLGEGMRTSIVATMAFIADDLVVGLIKVMKMWREDPAELIKIVRGGGNRKW